MVCTGKAALIRAFTAKIWAYLIGAIAVLFTVAISMWGRAKETEGRREERAQAKERDHEKAEGIRSRVERDLDDRVRDLDGAGWRD
ncbi:MAG: hypothetical protein EpisKO_41730 [Epibacterium sp.]